MKPSQAMKFSTPPLAALALAGLVLASAPCRAVRPYQPAATDPLLEPWRWRTFAELKGLGLRCLVEARDGALWFGVDEGVQRYDGIKWRTYSSAADGPYGAPVNVLFAARDGSVYAGSDKGISR